jgi:urease accessory protein
MLSSTSLAMLLADARLPVGGNANSAGLEPALRGGLDPEQVRSYMLTRASTVSLVEAGTAVAARCVTLEGAYDRLAGIDAAWAARTPSAVLRVTSRALGRGYLRLSSTLWPHPALAHVVGASRGVVLGATAAVAGLDAASLVRLVVYDDAQSVASAMLKLRPMDPLAVVAWVADACSSVEPLIDSIAAITSADAIPAFGAPQIEEWAEAHALLTQRLFNA